MVVSYLQLVIDRPPLLLLPLLFLSLHNPLLHYQVILVEIVFVFGDELIAQLRSNGGFRRFLRESPV